MDAQRTLYLFVSSHFHAENRLPLFLEMRPVFCGIAAIFACAKAPVK
jgi:hypothetical protein